MAFTPGQQNSITTGNTEVTICSAPAASAQRIIRYISVYNADTVAAVVTVNFQEASTERIIVKATLAAGESLEMNGPIVLANTDETLEVVLNAAVTTTELPVYVAYADIT
jgi:hypothetical protein